MIDLNYKSYAIELVDGTRRVIVNKNTSILFF